MIGWSEKQSTIRFVVSIHFGIMLRGVLVVLMVLFSRLSPDR